MKHWQFYLGTFILVYIFMFFIPSQLLRLSTEYFLPNLFIPNSMTLLSGISLIALSIMNFVYCANILIVHGKNSNPLITQPPKEFVVQGFYKYARNPIYIGHLFFFIGEILIFGDLLLFLYAVFVFICLHIFIISYEEPGLRKKFGESYIQYTKKVKRWGVI